MNDEHPRVFAIRAIARRWVELRLAGDGAASRRALAGFVARIGRAFTALERDEFFVAVEHCVAEHRERLAQRQTRLVELSSEVVSARARFEERPTIVMPRRPDRLSDPEVVSARCA
jgi:hypothetical protein